MKQGLVEGVLCALGAGLFWGLVFVAPRMLPDYPPTMLAFGRYLAFGAIALPLAWRDRARLASLTRADWRMAFELALSGNILYYLCLASAIQLADAPLPTLIIGTLPVVIALLGNARDATLPWSRLLPPLALIAAGIALVNRQELARLAPGAGRDYGLGLAFALAALVCWTWYPLRNAHWLKRNTRLGSGTWATAQGLATLPLALAGLVGVLLVAPPSGFALPLGPRPFAYLGLMFAMGLCASWLGTLLWNRASRVLPAALAGQLIVFETLAAFTYAFLWRGEWPAASAFAGLALMLAGVAAAVWAVRRHTRA
ncbi:DMT family transporter [Niveibacterium umoris]|uniref:Drug/metabolite transporter (DMT)-like permease n=1 Tax=Niveibacterium umoris TaxID=1193620 RepID=A0A840BPV1_9RHOO|nr:drug/metabolite transporter (DMT)-like permease [Niveibacterium umoris]